MQHIYKILYTYLFCIYLISCTAQNKNTLNVSEFEKAITTDSVQVLDVRTPAEYAQGHIKNTLQANWNDPKEFERRIGFVDKNKPVYVYCLAGGRSAAAAKQMRDEGFKDVYELQGGINAWKAANKNLEGILPTTQMSIDAFNAVINLHKTVLVDFGAAWCPPCKTMEPILQNLQKSNSNKFTLLKVDGGNDETILQTYKVTALPVFIIFKNGKIVWRKDGIATEQEILSALN